MAARQGRLGNKVGMTQLIAEGGEVVPVTVIEAGPCYVTQIKTQAKDGYNAVQIGFGPAKRLNKPQLGHLRDLPRLRHLREIRTDDVGEYKVGQMIDVSQFDAGDMIDVTATSKGKGFAGAQPSRGKDRSRAESARRSRGRAGPEQWPGLHPFGGQDPGNAQAPGAVRIRAYPRTLGRRPGWGVALDPADDMQE